MPVLNSPGVDAPPAKSGAATKRARGARPAANAAVPVRRGGMSPGLFAGSSVTQSRSLAYQADVTEVVADYAAHPYSAVGKMFFFDNGGTGYVGSAWLVGPRAIITAAHCLFDRESGDFYNNMTFAPAYNGNATGQAEFQLDESVIDPRYANKPSEECLAWDFGAATLSTDLSQRFGYLGYDASGAIASEQVEAIGYPAEPRPIPPAENGGARDPETYPLDGARMWRSVGDFLGADHGVHGAANEMTGGCSGGPWVDGDIAIGLNSHRYVPHDNRMFSPVFDDDLLALVEWLDERGAL